MKSEEGVVLVSTLIIMTILMTLVGISAKMITNDINFTVHQEESVKAFYLAEAGVQKALQYIVNNKSDLSKINENDDWYSEADYNLTVEVDNTDYDGDGQGDGLPTENNNSVYRLIITGEFSGIKRKIKTTIAAGNDSNTITTGGKKEIYKDISIDSVKSDLGADSIPDYDFDSVEYDFNFKGKGKYKNGRNYELESGYVYYANKDLKLTVPGGYIKAEDVEPAILVVNGNLTIDKVNGIENIIFIVNGNFNYYNQDKGNFIGGLTAINTYIYSARDIIIQTKKNKEARISEIEYTGRMIAQGKTNIRANKGSIISSAEKIELPDVFTKYQSRTKPQILKWEEN